MIVPFFFFLLTDGMKPVNGAVKNDVDNAFTTKRDQYYDFNKTLEASKKKGNGVPDEVKEKENTKDTAAILDEDKKSDKKDKEGVRIYRVPKSKPAPKKMGIDLNKVDTTLNVKPTKDADELELGAEASNIKDEDKEEKEEEEKIIEVYDWWPLFISKR